MMPDLSTSYMGLNLRNPVIVGSSGLTKTLSGIKKCEEAGAGAVVLKSIFEEQFLTDEELQKEDYSIHPEALDYLRYGGLLEYAPRNITQMLEAAKKEMNIPIIASINCQTTRLWPSFAKQLESSGADALELNIYSLPIDLDSPGAVYEDRHLQTLKEIKKAVSIPVSIKLTSQITSIPFLAKRLSDAGCDGLVLFNWFVEPDIDVKTLKTRSQKGKGNFHQSLRWVALLSGRIGCDIASSGGAQSSRDVVKMILAGASAVQVCSLLYVNGLDEIAHLLEGLGTWKESCLTGDRS
jgi:dihydroorotate dehydrogenase (fumarate)